MGHWYVHVVRLFCALFTVYNGLTHSDAPHILAMVGADGRHALVALVVR